MTSMGRPQLLGTQRPRSGRRRSDPTLPNPGQSWGLGLSGGVQAGAWRWVCVCRHVPRGIPPAAAEPRQALRLQTHAAALRVSRCKTLCWQPKTNVNPCLPAGSLSRRLPQPPGGRAGTAGRLAGLESLPHARTDSPKSPFPPA